MIVRIWENFIHPISNFNVKLVVAKGGDRKKALSLPSIDHIFTDVTDGKQEWHTMSHYTARPRVFSQTWFCYKDLIVCYLTNSVESFRRWPYDDGIWEIHRWRRIKLTKIIAICIAMSRKKKMCGNKFRENYERSCTASRKLIK